MLYTEADLDWHNRQSRSSIERINRDFRPGIADRSANIRAYDTIYLGFPIWWYSAPSIINSFLEAYDFSRKKIILFATSGGSGFGKARESLRASCSDTTLISEGKVFYGCADSDEVARWIETMDT